MDHTPHTFDAYVHPFSCDSRRANQCRRTSVGATCISNKSFSRGSTSSGSPRAIAEQMSTARMRLNCTSMMARLFARYSGTRDARGCPLPWLALRGAAAAAAALACKRASERRLNGGDGGVLRREFVCLMTSNA
jgi:hypothetical protein